MTRRSSIPDSARFSRSCMTELAHTGVFRRHVVTNSHICPHCFRRLAEQRAKPLPPKWAGADHVADVEAHNVDAGETEYVPPHTDADGRPESAHDQARLCSACGRIDELGRVEFDDPLSTAEAMRRGQRIVERLREDGVELDADAFFEFVRQAKDDADARGKDYLIFVRAVAFGIKHAPLGGVASYDESGEIAEGASAGGRVAADS